MTSVLLTPVDFLHLLGNEWGILEGSYSAVIKQNYPASLQSLWITCLPAPAPEVPLVPWLCSQPCSALHLHPAHGCSRQEVQCCRHIYGCSNSSLSTYIKGILDEIQSSVYSLHVLRCENHEADILVEDLCDEKLKQEACLWVNKGHCNMCVIIR